MGLGWIKKLVNAKASTVITQNRMTTLSPSTFALTPTTITAMTGINLNSALQLPTSITSAVSSLSLHAGLTPLNPGFISGFSGALGTASTALNNLSTLQTKLLPAANHGAFGDFIAQAQTHITDGIDLKNATNFIQNSSFGDFGAGIKNMSTLATQGLSGTFGSLGDAAKVMEKAGPLFNTNDMATFGTGVGFVSKLQSANLANEIGLNQALEKNGVDLNRLTDPIYAGTVNNVLASINDRATIDKVVGELGVSPYKRIDNLSDLLDINKLVNTSTIPNYTGDIRTMGQQFYDMGASFDNPTAAVNLLNAMETPNVPALDAAIGSPAAMVAGVSSNIDNLVGTGTGPMGLPSMTDFTQTVSGGPDIEAFNIANAAIASGDIGSIVTATSNLEAAIAKSNSLWSKAGVDLTSPAPAGLGTSMTFATNLHRFGAETAGTGIDGVLKSMKTSTQYGDAIVAGLAEGKNRALLEANGITITRMGL